MSLLNVYRLKPSGPLMAMNGNAQALMSLYHHALLVSHLKPMKTAKNLRYRPAP
ncbi:MULTISPECIES: hypothetical protein [Pseudomonas syringae group]|nr:MULTISPECIES: hypothetical protein [Pseudomonas syringae group]MBM0207820.1 hypothetical protein [Pseudomonas syringae pv. maculicola]